MCLCILSEVGPTAQLSLSESLQPLQTSGYASPFYSFLTIFASVLGSDVCVTTELEREERSPTLETPWLKTLSGAGLCWELGLSTFHVTLYREDMEALGFMGSHLSEAFHGRLHLHGSQIHTAVSHLCLFFI